MRCGLVNRRDSQAFEGRMFQGSATETPNLGVVRSIRTASVVLSLVTVDGR